MTDRQDNPEALLVFLANETLVGDERKWVEAAVAADPNLQSQLAAVQDIRREMQADVPSATPGEFGLARLMRDIDVTEPKVTHRRSQFWKLSTAAAVALLGLQTVITWSPQAFDAELAGGGQVDLSGTTLVVAFSGHASERRIRALLLELNLQIVDGPSALGLYTLIAVDEAAHNAALSRLKAANTLVDNAEIGD